MHMINIAHGVNIRKRFVVASSQVITPHREAGYDIFLIQSLKGNNSHHVCLPITSKGWAKLASPMETSMHLNIYIWKLQGRALWKSIDAFKLKMVFSSVRMCSHDENDDDDDFTFYQDTFLLLWKTGIVSNQMEIISKFSLLMIRF